MPKFEIVENPEGLKINIRDIAGREQDLLEGFQECKEGRCTCPTNQYEKLETMEIEQENGEIELRLIARNGEEFDKGEIALCLDHTTQNLQTDETGDLNINQ